MPSTIGSGTTIINGHFYYNPSTPGFCIQINAYDPSTGKYCRDYVCFPNYLSECMPQRKQDITLDMSTKATALELIPNPASEQVEFKYGLTSEEGKIIVLNINGTIIKTFSIENYSGSLYVNSSDMNPGVYFVRLIGKNGECNEKKLIIIK